MSIREILTELKISEESLNSERAQSLLKEALLSYKKELDRDKEKNEIISDLNENVGVYYCGNYTRKCRKLIKELKRFNKKFIDIVFQKIISENSDLKVMFAWNLDPIYSRYNSSGSMIDAKFHIPNKNIIKNTGNIFSSTNLYFAEELVLDWTREMLEKICKPSAIGTQRILLVYMPLYLDFNRQTWHSAFDVSNYEKN